MINLRNLIVSFIFLLASVKNTFGASVNLLDASLEEAAAYFSQVTGNSYVVDLKSPAKISVSRSEINGPLEIHQLFGELLSGLDGRFVEIGPQKFSIRPAESIVEKQTDLSGIEVRRLNLENKISANGIKNLISSMSVLQSLQIIEILDKESAVIISGAPAQLDKMTGIVASLPSPTLASQDTQKELKPVLDIGSGQSSQPAPVADLPLTRDIVEVIDLSFADAGELAANLQPMFDTSQSEKSVGIAVHTSANQIILSGPLEKVRTVLSVIKKLDRTPRQVYVDAIIAEVSEETIARLGLQFSVNSDNISASLVTGLAGVNLGAAASDPFLAGAAGGVVAAGNGANIVPDIGLMLTALKGDTDNRILATPSLMTMENKESTILVGQNVPFITGQYTNSDGDKSQPFQTIKREDLGTLLKIKPRISPEGQIVMEIWQEVSRIDQSAAGLSDVVTVKRQISTSVTADEGETIAIGGLRIEQQELGISKVPLLGDLPVLGSLFRQESSSTVSRSLAIFLRPTLVSSKKQRKNVIKVWEQTLGKDLYETQEQKSIFIETKPVGERLRHISIRPKPRPQKYDKN